MATTFPQIQGGGSLLLAWQVRGKPVLVVGGGEVAAGRITGLLDADAIVTVVSPREGLNPEVAHRIDTKQVAVYHDRRFLPSDLDGDDDDDDGDDEEEEEEEGQASQKDRVNDHNPQLEMEPDCEPSPRTKPRFEPNAGTTNAHHAGDSERDTSPPVVAVNQRTQRRRGQRKRKRTARPTLVLTAIDDPTSSSEIWNLCKSKKIPANIADVPPECDFYFGSTYRDGPLQIMVSTNGNGPKMANLVRRRIETCLPPDMGRVICKVGSLRRMLRVQVPEDERGSKRMKWMSRVCVEWSLEDLVRLEQGDMKVLLGGFEDDVVLDARAVLGHRASVGNADVVWEFDGSFGFM